MPQKISITGNLTADPELRFTASGVAVASFTVADTKRVLDRQTNEWKDGPTLFQRCSVWRDQAENVSECLHRGDRVTVTGEIRTRSYETKEGEKRSVNEMEVEEVNVSLLYAKVAITKRQRDGASGSAPAPAAAPAAPASSAFPTEGDPF